MKHITKYILLLFLLAGLNNVVSSQTVNLTGYQYWFDGDVSSITTVAQTPSTNIPLIDSIVIAPLSLGLHTLHLRFKDQNDLYSSVVSFPFVRTNAAMLTEYEYWFDENVTSKILQTINSTTNYIFLDSIIFSGLSDGLHTLNIRWKDDKNMWSSPLRYHFVYFPVNLPGNTNQITNFEYWFNNDPGSIKSVIFSGTNFIHQVNIDSLPDGLNYMYWRFKDLSNSYSSVFSSLIVKYGNYNTFNNTITGYEYWFNADVSLRQYVPVANGQIAHQIEPTNVPEGLNQMFIRFKDSLGKWSSAYQYAFFKLKEDLPDTNMLVGYRYWIDENFSTTQYVWFTGQSPTVMFVDSIEWFNLDMGNHLFHLEFFDSLDLTTYTISDTFWYQPIPRPIWTVSGTTACDSLTVSFLNNSIDGHDYTWYFGDGDSSTTENSVHHYASPGMYDVSLKVYNNQTMTDSVVTVSQQIKVYETPDPDLGADTTICEYHSLLLDPGSFTGNYMWNTGASSQTILVDSNSGAGWYWVDILNGPCLGTDSIMITLDPCFSIAELDGVKGVQIWPSPADDYLNIKIKGVEKRFAIKIIDNMGKTVYKNELISEDLTTINVAFLATGVYQLVLSDNQGESTFSFVKK